MNNKLSKHHIRTCRKCKSIIHENSLHEYCERCYGKIEEIFEKIRVYLKEFPGATAHEIYQREGIPVHVTNNFVKDGRLVEIPNEHLNMECLRCGCLLLSVHHKYCPTCELAMIRELNAAKDSIQLVNEFKQEGKMRYKSFRNTN